MLRVVALGLTLVGVTACGSARVSHFGDLRVTSTKRAALHATAVPPDPGAPARNITDLEFVSPRVGFLASSTGQFDHEPARIQRTTDGGRTWQDVWTRPQTQLWWIAAAGRRTIVVGGTRFIVRSEDGGRTWKRFRSTLGDDGISRPQVSFVTPSLAFAFTDPSGWGVLPLLRSADGGRSWKRVGPKTVFDVDFVSPHVGFAVTFSRLFRSDDAGVTWHVIPTPHVPYALAAVDFVDEEHGFLGGGYAAATEQAPSQVLFATLDGGRTWQRRFVNPHRGFSPVGGGDPFADLRFIDSHDGWATTGLCKCCPSGPCAGAIYVTRDGGYTWRSRGDEVQLTTVGAHFAWAVPRCDFECDVVWRTTDAGRTWRPIARRDRIALSHVVVRGRDLALLSSDGATFASHDRGRSWRYGTLARRVRMTVGAPFYSTCTPAVIFEELGRTLTIDGKTHRPPFAPARAAIAGRRVLAVGLRGCTAVAAVSVNAGETWSLRKIPRDCAPQASADGDLWLTCSTFFLRSTNGGRTWVRRGFGMPIASIAAGRSREAWAVAGRDLYRLWHTTDGGDSWTEVWPQLPTRG